MSETNDPKSFLLLDKDKQTDHQIPSLSGSVRRRRHHTVFVVSAACLVITAVLLGITLAITLTASPRGLGGDSGGQSNCITPDVCNSNILDYIDERFDPCDDFYRYSCGNWFSNNPLSGRATWGTLIELAIDNYNHLSEYLARPVQNSDPDAIKKSKYIYSACTDVEFIQTNIVQHVRDFIKNSGGWAEIGILPDNGWDINKNLANDHYLGSLAFFTGTIGLDDLNSSKPMIRVSLTQTQLRNISALYNRMTLQQFSSLFHLNWVQYFNAMSNKAGFMLDFTEETVVIVETPDYFRSINEFVFLAANHNLTVNYAKWHLLHAEYTQFSASLRSSDEIKEIYRTDFPLIQTTNQACAQVVERIMPFAVARPFVEEFITTKVVNQVNETLNNVFKAFTKRIMENDWLDPQSKDACKDKVNAISTRIAYPDFIKSDSKLDEHYKNFPINSSNNIFEITAAARKFKYFLLLSVYMAGYVDKAVWTDLNPPTVVNAFYIQNFNQITVLAGILREPAYAVNWPPFLLYGTIGTILSHEITHGFDDQGRQFDKNGSRVQWWTNESITRFNQRAQCIVDQYSHYSLQGYPIDPQLTLGENIADNGGIHTAYRAYKNVMNGTSGEQSLIGGHTLDQLFFVAFAQLWCSEYSNAYLDTLLQTDPHSPDPARVFGTLVNSQEFAAAFKCPEGSKMNPAHKCQLW